MLVLVVAGCTSITDTMVEAKVSARDDSGEVVRDTGGDADADTDADGDADVDSAAPSDSAGDSEEPDADADGTPEREDCDDDDPTVGAPSTWFYDGDGDGYGDPSASLTACTQPAGYLVDGTDCDDTTDAVSPSDAEIWGNSADDDCDGATDEDDAIEGAWTGTIDMSFTDIGYCAGTYSCVGTAEATGASDGVGGMTLTGWYSCTAVSDGGYEYGYCATQTWTPTGAFELDAAGGTTFVGTVDAGDCAPYGFALDGILDANASVSGTGLLFGFGGTACPGGDTATITAEMNLVR